MPRKPKHSDMVCTICDTTIEVPLCCQDDMAIENDKLVCTMCGNQQHIPICCGKQMITATSN